MRLAAIGILGVSLALAVTAAQARDGWHTYTDRKAGYSILYPDGWRIDTDHVYTALGPGKDIHGTAFHIDPSLTIGTNLSDDSYLAVEVLPGAGRCTPDLFLDDATDKPHKKSNGNGIRWLVLDGADAGAGNIYEETVQAAVGSQPCIATRAFLHSTNIGNYDPGTVKAFRLGRINAIFDRIRHSFRLLPR